MVCCPESTCQQYASSDEGFSVPHLGPTIFLQTSFRGRRARDPARSALSNGRMAERRARSGADAPAPETAHPTPRPRWTLEQPPLPRPHQRNGLREQLLSALSAGVQLAPWACLVGREAHAATVLSTSDATASHELGLRFGAGATERVDEFETSGKEAPARAHRVVHEITAAAARPHRRFAARAWPILC